MPEFFPAAALVFPVAALGVSLFAGPLTWLRDRKDAIEAPRNSHLKATAHLKVTAHRLEGELFTFESPLGAWIGAKGVLLIRDGYDHLVLLAPGVTRMIRSSAWRLLTLRPAKQSCAW